ncbi:hypothetical protein OAM26_05085 [Porticoccaceae bacterium]|nr:hypothetical protein [Porticoccaceae bacterium]
MSICLMCGNNEVTSNDFSPNVYLKYYSSLLQNLADVFLKVTNQINDLGREVVLVVSTCNSCQNKYRKVPLFDFKTKKSGERIVRDLIRPYLDYGYKIDSIYIDGWSTKSSISNAKNLPDVYNTYFLKTTSEIFDQDKEIVSILALIFKMRCVDKARALEEIVKFLEEILMVPPYETFIYIGYFIEKLKNNKGFIQGCNNVKHQNRSEYVLNGLRNIAYSVMDMSSPDYLIFRDLLDTLD